MKHKTITLQQIEQEYFMIRANVSDYRLGQHFINCCIKDSSSHFFQLLWNEWEVCVARNMINEVITDNCWDVNKLIYIRGE